MKIAHPVSQRGHDLYETPAKATWRNSILDSGKLARVHVFRNRLPMMHRANWNGPRVSNPTAFAWFVRSRDHRGPSIWDRISWTSDDRTTRVNAQVPPPLEVPRQEICTDNAPPLTGSCARLERTIDLPCSACGQTVVVIEELARSRRPHQTPTKPRTRVTRCSCAGVRARASVNRMPRVGAAGPTSNDSEAMTIKRIRASECDRAYGCTRGRNVRTLQRKETDMTNDTVFDDLYGSKYFAATDLQGEALRCRLGKVDVAELRENDGSKKRKFVAYLEGVEKPLVLNKTNATRLASAFGKDRSKWIGLWVELYAEMTGLGKEGVRLRVLAPPATARAMMPPEPPPHDGTGIEDMSDRIPL
jgi:hypothetical protein